MKLELHLNYWKCMIVYNTKHLKFILQMFSTLLRANVYRGTNI